MSTIFFGTHPSLYVIWPLVSLTLLGITALIRMACDFGAPGLTQVEVPEPSEAERRARFDQLVTPPLVPFSPRNPRERS